MPQRSRPRHITASLPVQDRAVNREWAMRSLWRLMALRWLGGGSDVLTGDSAPIELLPSAEAAPVFRVARDPRPRPPAGLVSRAPGPRASEDLDPAAGRRDSDGDSMYLNGLPVKS